MNKILVLVNSIMLSVQVLGFGMGLERGQFGGSDLIIFSLVMLITVLNIVALSKK